MQCPHCEHRWMYKGNSEYYITCPQCHTKTQRETLEKTLLENLYLPPLPPQPEEERHKRRKYKII